MNVAEVIAAQLRDAGVRHLFGVPGGGSSLDLIEAAERIGLRFVLTATETAAAIAAIAQTELTDAPGACLAGLGPGATSLLNGVACALLDRAPLIVITDSHPASADGTTHQRLDQQALFAPVTKWSTAITVANARDTIVDAIARAMIPPRGPVHLDCPADVAAKTELTVDSPQSTATCEPCQLSTVDCELKIVDCRLFRRPLLIAGLGARAHAGAIRAFVRSHRVPAMVTYKAKGVVPDRDDWFAGVFANGALEQGIVAEADAIIAVGLDRVELLPRPWTPHQPTIDIAGDIASALQHVNEHLPPSEWDCDGLQQTIERQRFRLRSSGDGLTPDCVVAIASAALPGWRVTVDAGAHMFPATLLWPIDEPGGMLISNGLSTMGFALPAAIGASLAETARPVVALTGDAGLLMCAGELATLAREAPRVVVIVFNDRSLSLIGVKQRQREFERCGVDVAGVAWDVVARGFGLTAHVATSVAELEQALVAAHAHAGPTLIDVRVDAAPYGEMLRLVRG